MADSIKIIVRCRPFNQRQLDGKMKSIIQMEGQEVRIRNPEAPDDKPRKFAFHRSYYSTDDSMGHPPVTNEEVFNDIGKEVLQQIYGGFNATIFAYGQTGAGKSFSIQGKIPHIEGLLQLCLRDIFAKKEENSKKGEATTIKVTYLEIYNEKLRDLLNPHNEKEIRVIQMGTSITVSNTEAVTMNSLEDVLNAFEEGKKVRVVGSTKMNNTSSRSHAIFTIHYNDKQNAAKFNIVDLAGSERQTKTGATGDRLKEANNINASLTNLGIVIEKLATNCMHKKNDFIPYRNSVLTHMLSESLAGNSKTFMIAALSPADDNYEETLGTLKFAQRASLISTQTKKNFSSKEAYTKELLGQIERLKKELNASKQGAPVGGAVVQDSTDITARISMMMGEVEQNKQDKEALMKELEEERKKSAEMEAGRKKLLEEAGLSKNLTDINKRKEPYIMNVSEDPTLLGMLVYDLKEGETKIGTKDGDDNQIKLNVLGILNRHCTIINKGGNITIEPFPEAKIFINGTIVTQKREVNHLDRITLGHANNFKLIIPGKASVGDELRQSSVGGQFGEYLDDKVGTNTLQAKSMKQFLVEMQQRMDRHIFSKFLEKFKSFYEEVDEMNQFTIQRYKKFPLKSKNIHFRINTVVDIENYMRSVPEMVVICEHKETKERLFLWSQEKFQNRLADMQSWYEGSDKVGSTQDSFDPWFEASDEYLKEKLKIEHMGAKDIVEMWDEKQKTNAVAYKQVIAEINTILKEMAGSGYKEEVIENYADYYFRNFAPQESSKSKIEEMRAKEEVHNKIHRYMECYAEMADCEENNKFYNLQRGKYMRGAAKEPEAPKQAPPPPPQPVETKSPAPPQTSSGGNNEELEKELRALKSKVSDLETELSSHDSKTDELHEEIKRQAKIIAKSK